MNLPLARSSFGNSALLMYLRNDANYSKMTGKIAAQVREI